MIAQAEESWTMNELQTRMNMAYRSIERESRGVNGTFNIVHLRAAEETFNAYTEDYEKLAHDETYVPLWWSLP